MRSISDDISPSGSASKTGPFDDICLLVDFAGFTDPFHHDTVTLDNPAYRYWIFSLMKGKLDWLLLRKMQVLKTSIGNHDYSASDHKWLCATVKLS